MAFQLRDPETSALHLLSSGEVVPSLDLGEEGRVGMARQFTAREGGGEDNVARGLRHCFDRETALVSAFADNPVGRLPGDFIYWNSVLWHDGEFLESCEYENLEIMDRVGRGDIFASGFPYGFLAGEGAAVNYGAVHGALAMTTPGDTSMATRDEVKKPTKGGSVRVVR